MICQNCGSCEYCLVKDSLGRECYKCIRCGYEIYKMMW